VISVLLRGDLSGDLSASLGALGDTAFFDADLEHRDNCDCIPATP
jgi:hypothetical protein